MKNLLIVCFLVAGLAFAGCTSTRQAGNSLDDLTNEEIEAYNNNPNNTDRIVCTEETEIGSRIPKRVCRKESAIDARSRQDQQSLEQIQRAPIIHRTEGQ